MKALRMLTLFSNILLLVSLVGTWLFVESEETIWIAWLFYLLVIIAPIFSIISGLANRSTQPSN
jgi:hypothetical protein